MKKSYVDVTVRLIIRYDEDQNIEDVLENMDYDFTALSGADIEDMEITSWQITDSK